MGMLSPPSAGSAMPTSSSTSSPGGGSKRLSIVQAAIAKFNSQAAAAVPAPPLPLPKPRAFFQKQQKEKSRYQSTNRRSNHAPKIPKKNLSNDTLSTAASSSVEDDEGSIECLPVYEDIDVEVYPSSRGSVQKTTVRASSSFSTYTIAMKGFLGSGNRTSKHVMPQSLLSASDNARTPLCDSLRSADSTHHESQQPEIEQQATTAGAGDRSKRLSLVQGAIAKFNAKATATVPVPPPRDPSPRAFLQGGGKRLSLVVQGALAKFNAKVPAAPVPTPLPLTIPPPQAFLRKQREAKSRYQPIYRDSTGHNAPKMRNWGHDSSSTMSLTMSHLEGDEGSSDELLPSDQDIDVEASSPPSRIVKTNAAASSTTRKGSGSNSSSEEPVYQLILPGSYHTEPLRYSFPVDPTTLEQQQQDDEQDEVDRRRNMSISFKEEVDGLLFEPPPEDSTSDLFYNNEEIANFRHEAFLEECGLDPYAEYDSSGRDAPKTGNWGQDSSSTVSLSCSFAEDDEESMDELLPSSASASLSLDDEEESIDCLPLHKDIDVEVFPPSPFVEKTIALALMTLLLNHTNETTSPSAGNKTSSTSPAAAIAGGGDKGLSLVQGAIAKFNAKSAAADPVPPPTVPSPRAFLQAGGKRLSLVQGAITKFNAKATAAPVSAPPPTVPFSRAFLREQKVEKSRYQPSNDDSRGYDDAPKTRNWAHDSISTSSLSMSHVEDDEGGLEELLPLCQASDVEASSPPSRVVETNAASSSSTREGLGGSSSSKKESVYQLILLGSEHTEPLRDLEEEGQPFDEQVEVGRRHNMSICFKEEVDSRLFEPPPEDSASDLFYNNDEIANFRHEAFLGAAWIRMRNTNRLIGAPTTTMRCFE